MGSKLRWLLISACGVLFALTLVGTYDVHYYFFDEPIYVDAAESLRNGDEVQNWEHPPLGKYFILAGRMLFEDNKIVGARLPSVVALLITLAFIGLIAERLFYGKVAVGLAGGLAILLALTDPLLVNLSKVAMLETFVLAFTVAGLFYVLRFLQDGKRSDILALGICCGLAVACKWSAVPVFAVFFAVVLWREFKWGSIALGVAVSIYVASFVPYLWIRSQPISVADIIDLHVSMFTFHKTFSYEFPHQSAWYTWPILFRPVWLLAETASDKTQGLFLIGNLLTYWLGPLGLLWYAIRRPSRESWLLLAGYLSTLVFWAVAGRRTYFYYYLMCAPFLYLGVLVLLWQAYKRIPAMAYATAVAIVTVFAIYYPIVRFYPLAPEVSRATLFVPSWRYIFE